MTNFQTPDPETIIAACKYSEIKTVSFSYELKLHFVPPPCEGH